TSSSGVSSWTSVRTGTPTSLFTFSRSLSPASSPGPRKLSMELRFALSKELLKMNGMPRAEVISFRRPAVSMARVSLSRTHGPAMRKNGRSWPTSKSHNRILQFPRPQRLMVQRGADEPGKQRMAVPGRRTELRVELAADEPGVVRELHDLHQRAVRGRARDHEAVLLQLAAVAVVELVAVPVPLHDGFLPVEVPRQRPLCQHARLAAEAHGTAEVRLLVPVLDAPVPVHPLGDEADDGMGRR